MKLAPQQFKSILRAMLGSVTGIDQRRSERFPVCAAVEQAAVEDGRPGRWNTALTRDVSDEGVGLVTSFVMPVRRQVAVRLPLPGGKPVVLLCRVMHSSHVADGLYLSGLEFEELIDAPLGPDAETAPPPACTT